MTYNFIRYAILIVLLLLLIVLYRKRLKKVVFIVSLIIAIMLGSIINYLPFENLFLNFSSAEAAFHYQYSGNIEALIKGEESTMVLYSNKSMKTVIFPKSEQGWKLSSFFENTVHSEYFGDYTINIYKYNEINDYYVLVWNPFASNIVDVSDNRGSVFMEYKEADVEFDTFNLIYYSSISDYEDYELLIDRQVVKISDNFK